MKKILFILALSYSIPSIIARRVTIVNYTDAPITFKQNGKNMGRIFDRKTGSFTPTFDTSNDSFNLEFIYDNGNGKKVTVQVPATDYNLRVEVRNEGARVLDNAVPGQPPMPTTRRSQRAENMPGSK